MSSEALQHAALGWLGAGTTARLMFDADFRIRWTNRAAKEALDTRDWIESKDGLLTIAQNPGAPALAAEVARLNDGEVFVGSYRSPADGGQIVMVVRRLPAGESGHRLFGLELRRRSDSEAVRYTGYRSWFGITQAEDRVLQQLLKGHNVEKCAAHLDISVDTVRSHVRQLYTKMNVSSREALFHAIMPFRVS